MKLFLLFFVFIFHVVDVDVVVVVVVVDASDLLLMDMFAPGDEKTF